MSILHAKVRTGGKTRALRRSGSVPAVVYGPTMESTAIVLDRKELQAVFSQITRSSRIDLAVGDHGKPKKLAVFIKAIQYDPITDEPLHVDFYHPAADRPLKLEVPIKLVGQSPGVKAGGVLAVLSRTVPVHGLPNDMPPLLTVDVSALELGQAIRVGDVGFGNVQPLFPPYRVLAVVVLPKAVVAEPTATEEAEAAEEGAAEGAGEEPTQGD
jgi:large subunit ribosomal protein L25